MSTSNTLGGYEIVREIARSNDIVYEAFDRTMNRRIALKELALPPNLVGAERRDRIERFYREARAAGNLSHPNIVTIYKVGEENGRHFIAMEFLEGDTLRSQLQVAGPLSVARAVEICAQMCDALDYAHQHGVVHRDIKPDNIQILPDGTARLTDFGIARVGSEPGITQAGQVFGTPSYMSPEQIVGKAVDRRSDIFSLGVVLYEVLTARKPFTGDSVVTITYNIMNMEPMSPAGVPPHLQQIVRKAMAKDPNHRYATASEMAQALRAPAPPATPFPATQHVASLPRVNTLGGPGMPAAGGWTPAPPAGHSAPGGYSGPMGYGAPPQSPGGFGGAFPPAATQAVAAPMPSHLAGVPPPALPPSRPSLTAGVHSFVTRQGPFLTLLGLVLVFFLIAVGIFWALTAGYEASKNVPSRDTSELIRTNDKAVALLNTGYFAQAKPLLDSVLRRASPDSPVYKNTMHSLGVYWYEAAQDAQQRGDLRTAQDEYEKAQPLLPEKSDELNQNLTSIRLALSGPSSGTTSTASPAPFSSPGSGPSGQASDSGAAPGAAETAPPSGSAPPVAVPPPVVPVVPTPEPGASTEEQARAEYQAGLSTEGRDPEAALDHFQKSMAFPGSNFADDAWNHILALRQRLNLSGLPPPG